MDGTLTDGYAIVRLTRNHDRPVQIDLVINTGIKGAKDPGAELDWDDELPPEGNTAKRVREHTTFHFTLKMDEWGNVERFVVPEGAREHLK